MPNFYKFELSGSTDGAGLTVPSVSYGAPGVIVHAATTNSGTDGNEYDEIWVWAANIDASPRTLGLQVGAGAGAALTNSMLAHYTVPAQGAGAMLVVPGWILQASLYLRATASLASVINLFGYVNRIARQ